MSAGVVFQQALRILGRVPLPDAARRDVLAVLEAGRQGPLALFRAAAAEAGVPRERALDRSAACTFGYCAGQLADDLCDRECDYLEDPWRTGPAVQFLLQNLCFHAALAAEVSAEDAAAAAFDLARGAGPQLVEVRTARFTAALFRQVAEGLAGCQFSAYLRILWSGTERAAAAPRVGMALGVAAHTAVDRRTGDRRFHGLAPAERARVLRDAARAADVLRGERSRWLDALLRDVLPDLEPEAEPEAEAMEPDAEAGGHAVGSAPARDDAPGTA